MKSSRREGSSFVGRERKSKIRSCMGLLKCIIHAPLLFPNGQLWNLTRFKLCQNVCIQRTERVELFHVVWQSSPSDPGSPPHQHYRYQQQLHTCASRSPPPAGTLRCRAPSPHRHTERGIGNTQACPKCFSAEGGFSSLQPTHAGLEGQQRAAAPTDPGLMGEGGIIPGGQLCSKRWGNLLRPWQRTVLQKLSWTLPPLQPQQTNLYHDAVLKGLFAELQQNRRGRDARGWMSAP